MKSFNINYVEALITKFYNYVPTLVLGLITLLFGLLIVSIFEKSLRKILTKRQLDVSLVSFISSSLKILLQVSVVISVLGILGIKTTSFIALLGSAGLAIGLALQGSLSNFAGGFLILILKPFKTGDFIEAQGHSGTVDSISVFVTKLKTPDNKVIFIPNGPLANGSIINYSHEDRRRVDFIFGIGYGDDIKKAKDTILSEISNHPKVLNDPEPFIAVSQLADSSVNITVRAWSLKEDYWDVYFNGLEKVKYALDKENISIPYPQTELHINNPT